MRYYDADLSGDLNPRELGAMLGAVGLVLSGKEVRVWLHAAIWLSIAAHSQQLFVGEAAWVAWVRAPCDLLPAVWVVGIVGDMA